MRDRGVVQPTSNRDRFWLALALIVLAALAWRVAFTSVTKGDDNDLTDEGDANYYSLVADNLSNGDWFVAGFTGVPTAEHPPLTVVALAPASWLFHSPLTQRLTMSLVGALTVGLIGLWGREIGGRRVGIAAALIAAVNPNLWINDAVIMSESVMALVLAALLFAGSRLARDPTMGRAILAGGLCGLGILTRAEAGLFLPLMIVPILLLSRSISIRARLLRLAGATLAVAAVIVPWSVWNSTRFENPVLVSSNDGITLAGANCDVTYYTHLIGFWDLACGYDGYDDRLDPSQNAPILRRHALDYAREHAGRLPLVVIAREGRTFGYWRPDQMVEATVGEGRPKAASWAAFISFWILAPASIVGAVVLRRRRVSLIPFAAALASPVIVSAFLSGIPRHRLSLDIATCVLAAVAVVAFAGTVPGSRRDEKVPGMSTSARQS